MREIDYNQVFEFDVTLENAKVLRPGSLSAWVTGMMRALQMSRTPLAYYVIKGIQGCRGQLVSATSTALFPIPLPRDDAWMGVPEKLGKQRRFRLALRRAVHLVVLALNYVYLSSPMSCLSLLRRSPSAMHSAVYDRVGAFLRAGGPSGEFHALGCGRKSFQLDARFQELLVSLQSLGLEAAGAPYAGSGCGVRVPVVNDRDELVPYRSLDPSRLKISGTGEWDASKYLSDLLYLPLMEPMLITYDIEAPDSETPDFSKLTSTLVKELCRVWDCRGLLRIFPKAAGPLSCRGCTKVFNNYKGPLVDRQIGDRRAVNYAEGTILGPSKWLPQGTMLLQVAPRRYEEILRGAVADRKDFYHQVKISDSKALKNAVFPFFVAKDFEETRAYAEFVEKYGMKTKRKRRPREEVGDFLHGRPTSLLVSPEDEVVACFGALFQGDHLGVEVATDSHSRLLEEGRLLRPSSRFLAGIPIIDDDVNEGLVIDDFFVVSREKLTTKACDSQALNRLMIAKEIYAREGLVGSDDKDVLGELRYKMAGAEVISDVSSVGRGLVSVGAPYEKRMGLALLAMLQSSLPSTSDAFLACLNGSLVSTLMFRRPAMALMNELFRVIPPQELNVSEPVTRHLSRSAAVELQLLACLMPVLASNVSVPFLEKAFATDASTTMGGIAETDITSEEAAVLWRSADRKGANLPILSKFEEMRSIHEVMYEPQSCEGCPFEDPCDAEDKFEKEKVPRPIGMRFGWCRASHKSPHRSWDQLWASDRH